MKIPFVLRLLLAFGAGAALVLAFAPFDGGWLAPAALALLFLLWWRTDARRAFGLGWAFGLGHMGFGVFWLHHSIAQFGGFDPISAKAVTLAFAAFLAGFPALVGGLVNRWLPPGRARLWLGYPAAWVLAEWLRTWLFTGFPWLLVGYSQTDTPLAGWAPLAGVLGVSLAVALAASALAGLVAGGWAGLRRPAPWALLVVLYLGGWGLSWPTWSRPAGAPLTVALVQPNIPQAIKWRPEQRLPTLERLLRLSEGAPEAELVIWPETAVPAFAEVLQADFLDPVDRRWRQAGRRLLLGIPVSETSARYYNAAIVLGASPPSHYYKRHLVPFGEYLPFKAWLGPVMDWLAVPMSDFSAGTQARPLMTVGPHAVGLSICYEDAFGREVAQALPDAHYLVNLSNDAWFGDSLAPHQHLQMARMRALETARWLLRGTNTGISALIDPKGRVVGRQRLFTTGVLQGRIEPLAGATPYVKWGDGPVLGLILLMLMAAWRSGRRPGSGSRP